MKFNKDISAAQVTRERQAWSVECVKLDVAGRAPHMLLAIDVHTRQPQVKVMRSAAAKDIAFALDRLFGQSEPPRQIWIDHGFDLSALRHYSLQHRVEVIHVPPSLRWKALSEPIIRDLHAAVYHWHFSSLNELDAGLRTWCRRYAVGRRH